MKKTNISKFIAVGLCICALTGCGASPNEKPDTSNPIVNSNTNEENTNGWTCKKCVKLCAQCQPQCKEQVMRHKTKSRRALLFPEVPGGKMLSESYSLLGVTVFPS